MKFKNQKYLLRFGSLKGKTAVITGASGAIGKHIVTNFLLMGAEVILPALPGEGEALKEELSSKFDGSRISVYPIDLCDTASIDKFAEEIKDKNINFLINNAGVIGKRAYQVNFWGTVYLTIKLTPLLNKNQGSKVAFQSSFSYRFSKIDWTDAESAKVEKKLKAYANSKKLLSLAIVTLKKDFLPAYPNVEYAIAHPGCVASDINGKVSDFSKKMSKLFLHSAETGSLSVTTAALKPVPENRLVGPRCVGIWGKPRFRKLSKSIFDEKELEQIKQLISPLFERV
ncbi:MAG: SDR family NAD(P)-dependent oxidoreductase [Christensenellaceae bacterium]|jgi:NAD(P)-dependent dehydrogenase (short-subunit alcohol dehydrogenase family)|nr:SDR family NAD(P)-dependent oxidoreductase [Christensenellaceae bacterium]